MLWVMKSVTAVGQQRSLNNVVADHFAGTSHPFSAMACIVLCGTATLWVPCVHVIEFSLPRLHGEELSARAHRTWEDVKAWWHADVMKKMTKREACSKRKKRVSLSHGCEGKTPWEDGKAGVNAKRRVRLVSWCLRRDQQTGQALLRAPTQELGIFRQVSQGNHLNNWWVTDPRTWKVRHKFPSGRWHRIRVATSEECRASLKTLLSCLAAPVCGCRLSGWALVLLAAVFLALVCVFCFQCGGAQTRGPGFQLAFPLLFWDLVPFFLNAQVGGTVDVYFVTDQMVGYRRSTVATILGGEIVYLSANHRLVVPSTGCVHRDALWTVYEMAGLVLPDGYDVSAGFLLRRRPAEHPVSGCSFSSWSWGVTYHVLSLKPCLFFFCSSLSPPRRCFAILVSFTRRTPWVDAEGGNAGTSVPHGRVWVSLVHLFFLLSLGRVVALCLGYASVILVCLAFAWLCSGTSPPLGPRVSILARSTSTMSSMACFLVCGTRHLWFVGIVVHLWGRGFLECLTIDALMCTSAPVPCGVRVDTLLMVPWSRWMGLQFAVRRTPATILSSLFKNSQGAASHNFGGVVDGSSQGVKAGLLAIYFL